MAVSRSSVLLNLGRVLLLLAVAFFAWWSLRGHFGEIGRATGDTSLLGLLAAVGLVSVGLVLTGFLWLRVLDAYGYRLPLADGLAIYLVGRLGKYVPGTVWAIGAQAQLARRHDVPIRATVGASLVFVGYNVATAMVAGGLIVLGGGVGVALPSWLVAAGVLIAAVGMLPLVANQIGARVGGAPLRLRALDAGLLAVLMVVVWGIYALALLAITPDPSWRVLVALAGGFTLGYGLGMVVFLAPAGLGAREATFIALLAPVTGLAVATSVALLARVVHLVADFGVAGATWWLAGRRATRVAAPQTRHAAESHPQVPDPG